MSEGGAAEPKLGFIGWGAANRAIHGAIQSSGAARGAGTGQGARLFTQLSGGAVPEEMREATSVEALLAECGLVFMDAEPEDLEHLLPPMRLAVSDKNVIAVAGAHLAMGSIQSQLQERKLIQCLITAHLPPAEATFAYWATPEVALEERAAFR